MSASDILMSAAGNAGDKLYVDDVFSTYLYTGNGSTQTINNGIDLAGKGGMVWIKYRDTTASHALIDTARGRKLLSSDTTAAQYATVSPTSDLVSFDSSGFTLGTNEGGAVNGNGWNISSWTFRKAPKFFDVVTWTGNGINGRTIAHSLGQEPGMVIVKKTNGTKDWLVYHRSLGNAAFTLLNGTTAPTTGSALWWNTTPTSSTFTVSADDALNGSSQTYVAYLFAHDPSADGIIQCGSFTTDASGNATVNLGWEPQYLLMKKSSGVDQWYTVDVSRGWSQTNWNFIRPNNSSAEYGNATATGLSPNAVGFTTNNTITSTSSTYIYLAIRRPNKPPTSGSEVYNVQQTNTSRLVGDKYDSNLNAVDLYINHKQSGGLGAWWQDRLRGWKSLSSRGTEAEQGTTYIKQSSKQDELEYIGNWDNAIGYANWYFKRAPGFFDIVAYTGNSVSGRQIPHSLDTTPEIVIVKNRVSDGVNNQPWAVGTSLSPYADDSLVLNSTNGYATSSKPDYFGLTRPSKSTFSVGADAATNLSGWPYVAYLFASCPGVSKVGVYTGNGTTQTINCGFSTGTRFVLIKCTNYTGDWYVWDTVRGIVADNDPHLSLNTTAAEVTNDDSIDPSSSGFVVNQNTATNINYSGRTYLYLAIA
jgi:hypothetical protein